ncbi:MULTISPECIES: hypothetical protein [unclassified Neisseria]|nr:MULTISPECIES: hypothetical protein [unclassified Neisseria]MBF0803818.1 hypothetical protein [Neisseria sp. 19428wB4_WF04]
MLLRAGLAKPALCPLPPRPSEKYLLSDGLKPENENRIHHENRDCP